MMKTLNISGHDTEEQLYLASLCEPVKVKVSVIMQKKTEIPVRISNSTLMMCLENIQNLPVVTMEKYKMVQEIYALLS